MRRMVVTAVLLSACGAAPEFCPAQPTDDEYAVWDAVTRSLSNREVRLIRTPTVGCSGRCASWMTPELAADYVRCASTPVEIDKHQLAPDATTVAAAHAGGVTAYRLTRATFIGDDDAFVSATLASPTGGMNDSGWVYGGDAQVRRTSTGWRVDWITKSSAN